MVALADLYLHPLNPRQSVTDDEITALASSIKALGLMQNLLGFEDGERDGIGIVAGGRRLRALQHSAEQGGLDSNGITIPVKITPDAAEADTWAKAENTARRDLHPAAEIDAYRQMASAGSSIQTIAKVFAVSERHVKARLKLADLAPKVLDALAENQLTLEQAASFTLAPDVDAQLEHLADAIRWDSTAEDIRHRFTYEATEEGRGLARFVTRAEYEDAGGTVREDFFSDGVYFEDGAALQKAAKLKLDAIADQNRAEGWKWVDVIPGRVSYEQYEGFERTYPNQAEISEAEEAEYDQLAAALEAGSATEDEANRFAELEERLRIEVFSEAQRGVSGLIIGLDHSFEVRVERGLVRKDDIAAAVEADVIAPRSERAKPAQKTGVACYSAALAADLVAIRTAAVQQAVLSDPALALDLLAFAVSTPCYAEAFPLQVQTDMPTRAPSVTDGFDPDSRIVSEGLTMPLREAEATKRFKAFRALPQAERSAILTEAVAGCLAGGFARSGKTSVFDCVAAETGAQVRTLWTPTGPGLFNRMKGADLDTIWMQLHAKRDASNFTKKKSDKVAYLHAVFTDPKMREQLSEDVRARVDAWVPKGTEIAEPKVAKKAPAKRGAKISKGAKAA